MTEERSDVDALRRRVANLETFADQVHRGAAMTFAGVGILTTALGLLLPYGRETIDETEHTYRLITFPFQALAEGDLDPDDANLFLTIGFLGLLVVVLGCLWLFVLVGMRAGSPRTVMAGRVFVVLSGIGTFVAFALWTGFDADERGPALVPLAIGLILAWIALSKAAQRLWVLRPGVRVGAP